MSNEITELESKIPECMRKHRGQFSERLKHIKSRMAKNQPVETNLLRLMEDVDRSYNTHRQRLSQMPRFQYPLALPILEKKAEIIRLIQQHQVIVVAGETGSGKTTQLPKMCMEAGQGSEGKIGCTQPRRVAATSIARYLKTETIGNPKAISYKIRFDTDDSDAAWIKIMTDGILLAEIHEDPMLEEYDTLIIDEAHERSLNIDFILGYLKRMLPKRPDLKIIISSATIDTESFSAFFDHAPIVEVSGRMYPVTVYYQPIDKEQEELGEVTMIDAAVNSAKFIFEADDTGSMLIFMPGEADIRETVDRLRGASWCHAEVLPLFSRLSAAEQNLIFQAPQQRKVIVATNIAETSITVPGIRYVIDTGYARISRYCPGSKTKRLPIEPIAQSSAQQRKGRCGRVQDGICIRLYSEDDFESREKFTPPEIKRSDLAEVILRLASLEMGDIESFPLMESPSRSAIRDGIQTLIELGAMDKDKCLTPLGWEIAKIPTDPRTARILLAAIQEGSLCEVLVIAAALSIQDPRERPFESAGKADECHRQFMDKTSDFASFWNLWQHFHETWSHLQTQNRIRKFCHQNFLSYTRMREWCDLHDELCDLLDDLGKLKIEAKAASYDTIHRAILTGFLSHICHKKEKNIFYARENQEVMVFPGSALFNEAPEWIVAAELVETSRLFARTIARIDPAWIEPLAKHLITYRYRDPHWNAQTGQVNAYEKVLLWGLVIEEQRSVHYGRINRTESRNILILHGLVRGETDVKIPFLQANQKLVALVRSWENKLRKCCFLADELVMEKFYQERLPDVVTMRELQQWCESHRPDQLKFSLQDILLQDKPNLDLQAYPDEMKLGTQRLSLRYEFEPDAVEDGITMVVPADLLHQLSADALSWLIPGWLEEKITELLKSLPKDARRRLMPLADRAQEIMQNMPRSYQSLLTSLEDFLYARYQLRVQRSDWNIAEMPKYLFLRFEVRDATGRILVTGRNLTALQEQIQNIKPNQAWEAARQKWYLPKLRNWCFDRLPEVIEITPFQGGLPHLGYPGLANRNGDIYRDLFHTLSEAETKTREATRLLLEYSLAPELNKLERTLSLLNTMQKKFSRLGWTNYLEEESLECAKLAFLQVGSSLIRSEQEFNQRRQDIRAQLWQWAGAWPDLLAAIYDQYEVIQDILHCDPYCDAQGYMEDTIKDVRKQLAELFPKHFLLEIPLPSLQHYPRYLKALEIRLRRAETDPSRDRKKCQDILPHIENLENAHLILDMAPHQKHLLQEYRWMIEEFKVSVFAQELGTPYPISNKKLQQKWTEIEEYIVR